jgi:hypothetical protein
MHADFDQSVDIRYVLPSIYCDPFALSMGDVIEGHWWCIHSWLKYQGEMKIEIEFHPGPFSPFSQCSTK